MPARPFARLARAEARPGHCIRCPRNTDLLDLGSEPVQDYGVLYLCTVCFGELADNMEMVAQPVHRAAVDNLAGRLARQETLTARAQALATQPADHVAALTKDLTHGITALVDRFARGLADAPVPRGDDLPVRVAVEVPAAVSPVPAGIVAGGDDTDPAAALLATLGLPPTVRVDEPAEPVGDGEDRVAAVSPAGHEGPARVPNRRRR